MMAVILAGGKGSRLEPFTVTIPKPLLPLGSMSILEVIIRQLATAGVRRVAVTLGHLPNLFKATLEDGARWGVQIEYYLEEEPLGTAGSLKFVKNLEENFLVMNGDILTTLDYQKLFSFHHGKKAWGTITVCERKHFVDFGVVLSKPDGLLDQYLEKPEVPYQVSTGMNMLSHKCLEYIPAGKKFDMPHLMLAMKAEGKPVYCYKTDSYWQDIGRFDDYQRANEDFINNPQRFLTCAGS